MTKEETLEFRVSLLLVRFQRTELPSLLIEIKTLATRRERSELIK